MTRSDAGKARPLLSRDEQAKRNQRILRYFISGYSERDIASIVKLSTSRIRGILQQELKAGAAYHQLLTDKALAIHLERLEALIKAVWGGVEEGDLKAVETARRILEQQSRLYSLETERVGAIPPTAELALPDDNARDVDELTAYRQRHRHQPDEQAGGQ